MAEDLTPGLISEAAKTDSASAWLWLFDVPVGQTDVLHVTNNLAPVEFEGRTYLPAPMSTPDVPEDTDVAAKTFRITYADIDQRLTDALRSQLLQGQVVRSRLVHQDHLEDGPALDREAIILAVTMDYQTRVATFTMGARNWLQANLGRRFQRLRCRHVYQSEACGYVGTLPTCDRTFNGSNGCTMHGDDEVARGLVRKHPARFGGEPGIPARNRG